MKRNLAIVCILAWMHVASPAFGEVARFAYEAVVTSIEIPAGHPIEDRLSIGDTIRGTLQYELTQPDVLPHLPTVGSYEALPAGENRFRAVGGNGFVFDTSLSPHPFFVATVDDNPSYDTLLVHMSGDTLPSTLQLADTRFVHMGLLLESTNTAALTSDALPRDLALTGFELAGIDFFGSGTTLPTFLVHTAITDLQTIHAIPGDYNADSRVDQADLDLVLLAWGRPANQVGAAWIGLPPEGNIDQSELDAVLLNWGMPKSRPSVPLPEPAAAGLALAGGLFVPLAALRARLVACCTRIGIERGGTTREPEGGAAACSSSESG
jgi:hypothetical protein